MPSWLYVPCLFKLTIRAGDGSFINAFHGRLGLFLANDAVLAAALDEGLDMATHIIAARAKQVIEQINELMQWMTLPHVHSFLRLRVDTREWLIV